MSAMGMVSQAESQVIIDVSPDTSSRLLERALRLQAPVTILPKAPTEVPLAARFWRSERDSIIIHFDAPPEIELLPSTNCSGVFELDQQEFMFSTFIIDVCQATTGTSAEIARPVSLETFQRRRFVRATVADSSRVGICALTDDAPEIVDGVILNISRDGLCCRVTLAEADRCPLDGRVQADFQLPTHDTAFRLTAVVRGKTSAGTRGHVLLNLQFDTPLTDPQRGQLDTILQDCG